MKYKKVKLLTVILFFSGLTGLRAQTVTNSEGNVYNTVIVGTSACFY